ncbi:MAG: hypothetical protein J5850_02625 [Clostridia bacterium]|nr:hypothetical protein [Clostridia bacterium]
MIDVMMFGAKGDGIANDLEAIQTALNFGVKDVYIPKGTYIVDAPIKVPSHKYINADPGARIVFVAKKMLTQTDFLLTNEDVDYGNDDITIEGGIWDGGFGREFNKKSTDIYEIGSSSGTCINFVTVRRLRLLNMTVANPVGYYVRLSRVRGFEIKNIRFSSEKPGPNQDGLHFGGLCRNGVVENVRAITKGQTNDDLLAFNADDSVIRQENRGISCGPIEDILVRNVYAEECHTAIRFASVTSAIKHVHIENIYAGCRCAGINMDANRYCRTPLFKEEGAPNGVGDVSEIKINNCTLFFTENAHNPIALIDAEEHCRDFEITDFHRPAGLDRFMDRPTLLARNLARQTIIADGEVTEITDKSQECVVNGEISTLRLDR